MAVYYLRQVFFLSIFGGNTFEPKLAAVYKNGGPFRKR